MGSKSAQESTLKKIKKVKHVLLRRILIACGLISVALGVIGLFLPVMPTTPFLLLAAFCFARSSEKLYDWLLENRVFGRYIKGYLEKRSIPAAVKIYALTVLWLAIGASIVFFVTFLPARVIIIVIAAAVTAHILSVKTG